MQQWLNRSDEWEFNWRARYRAADVADRCPDCGGLLEVTWLVVRGRQVAHAKPCKPCRDKFITGPQSADKKEPHKP